MFVVLVVVIVALCVIATLAWRLRSLGAQRDALASALAAERRAAAARAAEQASQGAFVATASHELRSPLTSVKGFAELLENGTRNGRFTSREREFVEIISRSTDRLVELVDELLDIARIDADSVQLRRAPIDVGEAIQEVAELMGPRLVDKDQQLGVYVAPTLPPALADAGRVRQIVANLLTNAHLYTPAGGRIHIGAEADRAWVRIVVADSGIGMTAEERSRIFERFYRGAGASSETPGTGLGMPIVRSLVELHGGEIDVASQPQHGTTVQVRLPASREESDGARETLRGRTVLIVGGDADAGAIAESLALVDAESAVAADGPGALAALRERPADAVALAPGARGADELVRAIRADADLHPTPIVFVGSQPGDPRLAGEWSVPAPATPSSLRGTLAAALRAGRSRVLVVARPQLSETLEPALDELGIEYEWVSSGATAARVSAERRFELALVDTGLRNPEAVLQALALRGRRLRRAVILVADDLSEPVSPSLGGDSGAVAPQLVSVREAPEALLAALRGHRSRHPSDTSQPRSPGTVDGAARSL